MITMRRLRALWLAALRLIADRAVKESGSMPVPALHIMRLCKVVPGQSPGALTLHKCLLCALRYRPSTGASARPSAFSLAAGRLQSRVEPNVSPGSPATLSRSERSTYYAAVFWH